MGGQRQRASAKQSIMENEKAKLAKTNKTEKKTTGAKSNRHSKSV